MLHCQVQQMMILDRNLQTLRQLPECAQNINAAIYRDTLLSDTVCVSIQKLMLYQQFWQRNITYGAVHNKAKSALHSTCINSKYIFSQAWMKNSIHHWKNWRQGYGSILEFCKQVYCDTYRIVASTSWYISYSEVNDSKVKQSFFPCDETVCMTPMTGLDHTIVWGNWWMPQT